MAPRISIIMPVYNAEKYLADAIDSVLAQSFEDFELILVDDGSHDQSGAICDQYAQKDSRVVVLHKENGGICDARNAGLRAATGQYVGFMDNDDYMEPDTLKENYALAQQHDADWVKFGKTELLIRGEKILATKPAQFTKAVYDNKALMEALMRLRTMSAMTFVWDSLLRRSIIEAQGLSFDTAFKHGNEDIDFCERFAAYCNKMVINPVCYYQHYTRFGISTSSKYSPEAIKGHLYLLQKSNARYKAYGIDGENTDREYLEVVTKQLVVSSVQKLNDAGKLLTTKDKIETLKTIQNHPEMARYEKCNSKLLRHTSKKLYLYCTLFQRGHFRMVLLLDKYSRKLVYLLRTLRQSMKKGKTQ